MQFIPTFPRRREFNRDQQPAPRYFLRFNVPNVPALPRTLIGFARACAGLCLLVAPFHASAGWRGGLLLLAAFAIVLQGLLRRSASGLLPDRPLVLAVTGWWVVSTLLWSQLFAPATTGEWKRDVLTPVLALPVYYALTRDRRDFIHWLWPLSTGLVLLTLFLLNDPTDAMESMRQPWYGGVGSLATWLIALAALAPMVMLEAETNRRVRWAMWVALSFLLVCAYFTMNRTVWVCFAAMLSIYAAGTMLPPHTPRARPIRVARTIFAGIGIFVALGFSSVQHRFENQVLAKVENDPRGQILSQSFAVAENEYRTGIGFGISALRERLMQRMADPSIADRYGHAHNLLLNYTLQMGVIGAITMLALMASLVWTFAGIRNRGGPLEVVGLCGLLLVAGVFLRNMTDDFFNRHNALLFWAITGMLLGLARSTPSKHEPPHPDPAP